MSTLEQHWSLDYIKNHPLYKRVLQHPYLIHFENGELSIDHLAHCWLLQQAWLSRTFPHAVAGLLAKMPPTLSDHSKSLAMIIREEIWSSSIKSGHPRLFHQLYLSLNSTFSLEQLPAALPGTESFYLKRHQFVQEETLDKVLGLLLCNEFINADFSGKHGIMVSYDKGLVKTLNQNVPYTSAHILEETEDAELLLNIINAVTPQSCSSTVAHVMEGIDRLLQLRKEFFDALYHQVLLERSSTKKEAS